MRPGEQDLEIKMDAADLYREEIFTDRKVGTLRRMMPVKIDGSVDDKRPVLWIGQAQMITPMGAIPLTFEVNANTLDEAIAQFGEGAKQAMERTIEELKEMRRQQASSIVIPEMGAGALGGGGKIQLP